MAIASSAETPKLSDVLGAPPPLDTDERLQIVRQARLLIEQLYVHLPLKRAMHAVDPVQRLRLLERRLGKMPERAFQDEMIAIFIGLRDLHTLYLLPSPYTGKFAVLPFRIEEYWDEEGKRRYIVTGVAPELDSPPFAPGVEVTHWNGVPIERAVALNGERHAGSNPAARHARGLAALTQRPMGLLSPPDEEWVEVTFRAGGETHAHRFDWLAIDRSRTPSSGDVSIADDPVNGALGLDLVVEDIRRAQKQVLAPAEIELESEMAAAGDEAPADRLAEVSTLPDVLQFRSVASPGGDLGYLRIRTFSTEPGPFVEEVMRILALLPQNGLIVDVRGNGGGYIAAGELLLQLFTSREIEPERLHFINTPLTLELAEQDAFGRWLESIGESVETGTPFSDGLPLAGDYPALCNSIGQHYHGPVALIVDPLCYSTTDIFAAGFQDHGIGPVIGTSDNTGAGGANVWEYGLLQQLLPERFEPLPKDAWMRVAVRRTTRVGERMGDPVEDLGVVPEHVHRMTKDDLLNGNVDLIAAAAGVLTGNG